MVDFFMHVGFALSLMDRVRLWPIQPRDARQMNLLMAVVSGRVSFGRPVPEAQVRQDRIKSG